MIHWALYVDVNRDKITRERLAKEDTERKLADMEMRLKESHEMNEGTQRQIEEYERKIRELEDLLEQANRRKIELEHMHRQLADNNKALENVRISAG